MTSLALSSMISTRVQIPDLQVCATAWNTWPKRLERETPFFSELAGAASSFQIKRPSPAFNAVLKPADSHKEKIPVYDPREQTHWRCAASNWAPRPLAVSLSSKGMMRTLLAMWRFCRMLVTHLSDALRNAEKAAIRLKRTSLLSSFPENDPTCHSVAGYSSS